MGKKGTFQWLMHTFRVGCGLYREPNHHLSTSTARIVPVPRLRIRESDVPDADVTIGTWWETREWIEDWPKRCGIHAYFVRCHEVYLCPKEKTRVAATYRMPGTLFVISSWIKNEMMEHYGRDDCILALNGVDRTQFTYTPRIRSDPFTIGLMYGKEEIKGARTALDAIHVLQSKYPSIHVVSFGVDSIDSGFQRPMNLEHHIQPPQDMIPQLYRKAHCWILPSVLEGFGMPGLEAAASGCPVVATRCGGAEDYVRDGVTGHLVSVGDSLAMANAIESVMQLAPEQWCEMSHAAYHASLDFDWDRTAEIVERHLLSVLSVK
jgi:glycosyltransferase involved in cell wall biosynthesis